MKVGAPAARAHLLIHTPSEGWRLFRRPRRTLLAATPGDVPDLLGELRDAVRGGAWAAGYFTYEATPAFDPAFAAHEPPPGEPVAWWGLYDEAESRAAPPAPEVLDVCRGADLRWRPLVGRDEHARAVEEVRRRISAGDTYQVNLTFPLEAEWPAGVDPYRLFLQWTGHPPPPYAAYLDLGPGDAGGDRIVASASPELFFSLRGDHLVARPMKGTAPRGRWTEEDDALRRELLSEKNRAENLMIADMLRNDVGRVAEPGSVRVTRLFGVETYATVHQLVSQVEGRLAAGRDAFDALRALFPCASITGAPKARTSHIIRELEPHPRGAYTGSAGYFAPDGSAQLSVLIRTAVFDRARRRVRYGTGGGVVWDSAAESEYREAATKTRILRPRRSRRDDFELLETLLWRPASGYFLLEHHLRRIADSARFFGFPWDTESVADELRRQARGWRERMRVRLLASRDGTFRMESTPEPCPGRSPIRTVLDDRPVDEQDVFLFHKTTRRAVYEEALSRHPEADDVILWNERGELTESTRANLIVQLGGRRWTPPRRCGLLGGTYRQALLDRGSVAERVLRPDDLRAAERVLLVNSVRGFRRVELL